ncbi:phage tail tube protein [Enterovirga sp. CN4-39]|uniref:phage tail tube protein n=1 Tax=Enterovirga sp. CN4-39 TaxID=3400910 RepID=UPI003C0F193C
MARARGANALMAGAFESVYGTPPVSGYKRLPFVSSNLGEEQGLIADDLLGFGREALAPSFDVINNVGDVVVPVDVRNFGNWLKLYFGNPATSGGVAAKGSILFSAQPANSSTIAIAGTAFTFVSSAPSGNQIQIGANLAATLTNAVTVLNASVVPAVAAATYAQTGGNTLTITHDTLGQAGNSFALAATAPSNGAISGATLSGGATQHVFTSGASTLPSMSIEVGLPDVPTYGMNFGVRGNTMRIGMQRSGLLSATLGLIAKGETKAGATAAGTPSVAEVKRFSQFTGSVKREGAQLASVVSAEFTFTNNLEPVETIRSDGRIEDADPGMVGMSGSIVTRFADTVLLDQAQSGAPCEISFGWAIDASTSLLFLVPAVYLPRAKQPVSGPGGVQATFNWQAARGAAGATCIATLVNDVASY